MALELAVSFIEESFDGGVFDCSVHAFDLAVGPWMLWLGEAMVDIGESTSILEGMGTERLFVCDELLVSRTYADSVMLEPYLPFGKLRANGAHPPSRCRFLTGALSMPCLPQACWLGGSPKLIRIETNSVKQSRWLTAPLLVAVFNIPHARTGHIAKCSFEGRARKCRFLTYAHLAD
jgi:hypothetical protein